jgi:hypothetical protein
MKRSAVMTRFEVGLALAADEVGIQRRTIKLIKLLMPDAKEHDGDNAGSRRTQPPLRNSRGSQN